ncbi:hypothetical protein MPT09_003329 [Salmonella enterica]|nr:hypothetical protein [Salmonella enterica]
MPVRKYVTKTEYHAYISQFSHIREVESIHRDDTDFHTYGTMNGEEKLIGWADY